MPAGPFALLRHCGRALYRSVIFFFFSSDLFLIFWGLSFRVLSRLAGVTCSELYEVSWQCHSVASVGILIGTLMQLYMYMYT